MFEKLTLKFKKSTFDKATDISKTRTSEFNIPLINAKFGDNGIMYYGRKDDFETASMTIDIVNDGAISTASVYPQPQETGVLYNAYLIKSLFDVNNQILYFLSTTIQKSIKEKFGYENKAGWEKVKKEFIQLPTKNGKIDFEFMDAYISELEEERISELEEERISELSAYLTVSGFDNYELSNDEKEALENLNLIQWEEKDVTGQEGIFSVKNTKNILSNDIKPNSGSTPYLCASADNNSVSSYIKYKEELKDKGNCIFIGGKTFVVSYQETDFFSNDSHNLALYLKEEDKADVINQLFMATCIRKSLSHKYSWGNSISNKKIQNDKVMLPIRNGVVDYKIMNTLISAVKKLVIKDVVIYADNKIEATKKVIHRN